MTQAQKNHVCAVAVAVIKNRTVESVKAASGCEPAVAVHADSVFQAASLSKPVFAYAVLKLVEQGQMQLDAPVVQYLPQGYRHQFDPLKPEPSELVTNPGIQAVTVRMVLNHTTGLPNWASKPLAFSAAPGAKWSYSGEGFVLLQRAVEAVTQQPLDQWMDAQVFQPLGMTRSSYVWRERFAPDFISGTKANGEPRRTLHLDRPVAAFSLYTTAADYGKFLAVLLKDDVVLQKLVASPVSVAPNLNLSWGLGWGIERTGGDNFIWQWGNNPGYRAFVMASPHTGDGFVMLTNSENGMPLAEPVAQNVLPGEHKVFQFSMLGGDPVTWLCTTLRLCL